MLNPDQPVPENYQVYLLRIWLECMPEVDNQPQEWRFSLEDAHSGTRRGFTNLESLAKFLNDRLSINPCTGQKAS